eukprot:624692-Amphidinium_carterae.1
MARRARRGRSAESFKLVGNRIVVVNFVVASLTATIACSLLRKLQNGERPSPKCAKRHAHVYKRHANTIYKLYRLDDIDYSIKFPERFARQMQASSITHEGYGQ